MLGTRNVVANLAVKDLDRAKQFYTGTLGLKQVGSEAEDMLILKSGDSIVNVYKSEFAGTNEATAVTWEVDDIDAEIRSLRQKGVTFEHYDMSGLELKGDIHVGDGMKIAWFKDPDGNILNIVEE